MATNTTNLDLLLKEIEDIYVQENFRRLKLYLDSLIEQGILGVPGNNIQNINVGGNNVETFWEDGSVTIPSSGTLIVDTVPLTSLNRAKYFLNFKGVTTSSTKGLDLTIQNNNGALTEVVTHKLGEALDVFVNVGDNGVDMGIEIVNNESESLNLSFIKNIL